VSREKAGSAETEEGGAAQAAQCSARERRKVRERYGSAASGVAVSGDPVRNIAREVGGMRQERVGARRKRHPVLQQEEV